MGSSLLKNLVSRERVRYKEDGFDLDLTYIKPWLIAMGYPGEKIEGLYRNNLEEVRKFLESKHRNHYRIYNLCNERNYDDSKFGGSVVRFPFQDHTPPTFKLIIDFCADVDIWLKKSTDNVAVVHCKAGKGRTGVMICCYMLHSEVCSTWEESLEQYARIRTNDGKGVTIPSQRRYVQYFDKYLQRGRVYDPKPVEIKKVTIKGLKCDKTFTLMLGDSSYELSNSSVIMSVRVCEDFGMSVYVKDRRLLKLFSFWLNTSFIDDPHLVLYKFDKLHKKHKVYLREDFSVEVEFQL